MASGQFSVAWDNFHKNMRSGMNSLLESEDFVDVTLAVEGRYLKAHKMVLSVCSPYFKELFKTNPCKHPIVFMKDVSYVILGDLLQFMYRGEVQVSEENFNTFIKTAESLQIRGLSNYGNDSAECGLEKATKLMESEAAKPRNSSPVPAPKRLRLDDYSNPLKVVRAESTRVGTALNNEDVLSIKTEPYEVEDSSIVMADEDSNENFPESNLEEINSVKIENSWMMEGDDEGTEHKLLPGEGDIEDSVGSATLIPERSKEKYEQAFARFEQWCNENNVKDLNEDILMSYFKEKSVTHKSSTLMAFYSMLRTMLSIKKNINIRKYRNLISFLKETSEGYTAKKSLILKREHFEKFLREANDDIFLMKKVVIIIGVAGACRREELTHLRIDNVIDEGNFIRVQLPDANNKISREFIVTAGNIKNVNLIEIIRKYISLRPSGMDHQRFFISYRQGKCTRQAVGINALGSVPKNIAQFLGLANPEQYTGHCFRRTSMLFKPKQTNFP